MSLAGEVIILEAQGADADLLCATLWIGYRRPRRMCGMVGYSRQLEVKADRDCSRSDAVVRRRKNWAGSWRRAAGRSADSSELPE